MPKKIENKVLTFQATAFARAFVFDPGERLSLKTPVPCSLVLSRVISLNVFYDDSELPDQQSIFDNTFDL